MNQRHWTEHLGEMRGRILMVLAAFILSLMIGLFFAEPIIRWTIGDILNGTLEKTVKLNIFSPGEALSIYMQFAFIVALAFTMPVAFYQAWKFVQPGLTKKEQKATLSYIPFAMLLFIAGLCFGYYWVFPFLLNFMAVLTERLGAQETYGMYEFFRFLFRVVFPIALLFELPVVILFLTRIRIVTPQLLRKGRRYAWLGMVVLAALVTPPDLVSNILVSIPLILLYEGSIFLSDRVYRKMLAEEEAYEAKWKEDEEEWGSSFE
ncbi:twin-arginine translocase subunit TatC [Salinithrix halophila]|uniref:Sec-independent protein translocase protein TatC n=1 Tax=Salinithrix halophila TaxID=1485204 RepID=A0ABV8JH50_9BACL